ncbi:MAG: hypothetical protein J6N76_01570, partial [Lachnospiraceae bacterium]|nr:hypothetical protein [Lachnospiraceae bacterium]
MMDIIKSDYYGRYTLIDHSLIGEGHTTESTRKVRLLAKGIEEKEEIPENLTENEIFARTLNAKADEISNSGRLRLRRKEHIAEKVNELLTGGISDILKSICRQILQYTQMNPTASDITKNINIKNFKDLEALKRDKSVYDLSDFFSLGFKLTAPKKKKEKDQLEGISRPPQWAAGMDDIQMEKLLVYQVRGTLEGCKQQILDGVAKLDPEMKERELKAIDKLLGLFSFSKGNLDVEHIPKNAKQINDTGITYESKGETLNMVDQRWAPLFEHEPCVEDVVQGDLGDCYFLGCIAALVEKNPSFIKEMMHDNGDTVTVRLYNPDKTPVYITMDKKLPAPKVSGADMFARGSFWVMYLEKAITLMQTGTMGVVAHIGRFNQVAKEGIMRNTRYYDHIIGGRAEDIMPIITGMDTEEYSVSLGVNHFSAKLTDEEIRQTRGGDVDRLIAFLENAVSSGKAITAATGYIKADDDQMGLNYEVMIHGIVATHQYAVLGVETISGKKMIKLRNPWGDGRMRYEVQKGTDVPVIRWGDRSDAGSFYITPERFVAYFHNVNTVDLRTETVEDMEAMEGDIAYEFLEDDRAKKTIGLHGYEKKKNSSEFDLEKWNDTLKTYVNTQKTGVEKKKYHLFYDALEGKTEELKKAGVDHEDVRLFSSVGDVYYYDRKENVLQFDLAGTAEDVFTRGADLTMIEGSDDYDTRFESHYGQKVEGFENVRKKEKRPEGGGPVKTRYNFGGASFFNGGENSMQNTEKRIEEYAKEWLKPILD